MKAGSGSGRRPAEPGAGSNRARMISAISRDGSSKLTKTGCKPCYLCTLFAYPAGDFIANGADRLRCRADAIIISQPSRPHKADRVLPGESLPCCARYRARPARSGRWSSFRRPCAAPLGSSDGSLRAGPPCLEGLIRLARPALPVVLFAIADRCLAEGAAQERAIVSPSGSRCLRYVPHRAWRAKDNFQIRRRRKGPSGRARADSRIGLRVIVRAHSMKVEYRDMLSSSFDLWLTVNRPWINGTTLSRRSASDGASGALPALVPNDRDRCGRGDTVDRFR